MKNPAIHNAKQNGQAIVLIAIMMVALIASLGLAIDGGGMYLLYRDVQNATDSAALSAAFALCSGGDPEEAGHASARLNGFVDGVDGATVNIENPPTTGNFTTALIGTLANEYVLINIQDEKPSYFIGIVYSGPLIVEANTISQCLQTVNFGWPENSSVVSLSPGCAAFGGSSQPPFKTVGGANHETSGGGIYINGDSASCDAAAENGTSNVVADGYGVCGHNTIDSGIETPEGSINESCPDGPIVGNPDPLYPDPYVEAGLTAPDCASMPLRTLDTSGNNVATVTPGLGDPGYNLPGRYTDFDIGVGGEAYLSTGIYCIDGTTGSASSTIKWQGTLITDETDGVMFYLYNAVESLESTSQANVELYALTDEDSDYTNLLIWDDAPALPSNSRAITLAGQTTFELEGTVYAPRTHCSISGGSGPNLVYGQFICYSADFSGNSGITIIFDPNRIFEIPSQFGVTQ